jgi:hypothetical protein
MVLFTPLQTHNKHYYRIRSAAVVVVQGRSAFRGGDSIVLVFLGGMMAWHVTPLEEVKDMTLEVR